MLTAQDDIPIIKHAILKKLDAERGIKVIENLVERHLSEDPPHLKVGVLALIDNKLIARARFDLPVEFELRHLHNEIDEIAESFKQMRKDYWRKGRPANIAEVEMGGSGFRGRWPA